MRIVSLCPSLTELVFDLGAGEELVGVTKWCVHPASEVSSIQKVGGTKDPDVARICDLQPDIVLLNEEENRLEDAESFKRAGVALHTSLPKTALETADMCRSIGKNLGRDLAAEKIAVEIEDECRKVVEWARGRDPVLWAYLIWRTPYMTVNADTYVNAILEQAGGRNVFGDLSQRYPEVTVEEIAAASPDRLFLCTEPFAFRERHVDELAECTGLDREIIRIADGELLSWCGSRTRSGVPYAAELLGRRSDSSATRRSESPGPARRA